MKFKRSKLISADLVVGYLLYTHKSNIKKVKLRKRHLTEADSHFYPQASLVRQQVKVIIFGNCSSQVSKHKKRTFTIKELFEKYEQSYHDALYLEAIKFLLEQIFWLSPNYPEE
jgi:hypothetical protein